MTVQHVLLVCPTWNALRQELLSKFQTTDLRKLLGERKSALAAIKFILQTDLLAQFRAVARQEQAKRQQQQLLHETNSHLYNEESLSQEDNFESDSSQSDSIFSGDTQAVNMLFTGVESS